MTLFTITKQYDGSKATGLGEGAAEVVYRVQLELIRGDLRLTVDAPFFDDPPPPPLVSEEGHEATSARYPGLYKHECCEVFIASGVAGTKSSENPYLEIEFGPYGHFYMISFQGQALWSSQDDTLVFESQPDIVIDRDKRRWYCRATIPFFLLPEPGTEPNDLTALIWKINCVAIHGRDRTRREYLSQNLLPGISPNFHQLDFFAPFTLNDKDAQRLRSLSVSKSSRTWSLPFGVSSLISTSSTSRPPLSPQLSIEQTIEDIKTRNRSEANTNFEKLVASLLLEGETVLLCSSLRKRKSWSHKQRLLILTSKPRLIYFSTKAPYKFKGFIEWSMQLPVEVKRLSDTAMDIVLHDKSRIYHWFDDAPQPNPGGGAKTLDAWEEAICSINSSWENYLRQNFAYAETSFPRLPAPPLPTPPPPPTSATPCHLL